MIDDGRTPVPLADACGALRPRALAFARCKPDMETHARWGHISVQVRAMILVLSSRV